MNTSTIYYCRECRESHHMGIKNLKNAFLEKHENVPALGHHEMGVLNDYAWKNVIKKPEDIVGLSRMAAATKKEWRSGKILTVSFIGGDWRVIQRLIRHARIWMDYANIELDFTPRGRPGDIRIAFDPKGGSWSYIGTEILGVDTFKPTMNFGWLTPTLDDLEYNRVVVHEFGHALGCIHEHERADNGIPWDKPKVYAYYKKVDGWEPAEVDHQVFAKYDMSMLRANKLDKDSIMMYPVPEALTIGNYSIGWNNDLSEGDKKFIAELYPKR